ncbi:MAG TPA: ABC transporter ATP-binding protein [Streptosporangiaceae bacterium]|nr:ABC transporter ATP-binding protein [Streptosporangiaceae bacterium]
MPSVIEVRGLTKRFGEVLAVDQLSFTVRRGTVTGFLGPNGAGKTTTLRMLLGLVAPSTGTAVINGYPYRELPEPRHVVGAVLEASNPYPGRSAVNHLRIEALAGEVPRSRVDEVLDMVDLTEAAGRRVGQYSLGMRQRLGLATALLGDPEILILDEPANGLDPEGVHWLRRLLRKLAGEGRTVLVSSHILAEVAQTVDSVVIMNHGRLVTEARLDELTERATQLIRVRTPQAAQLAALLAKNGASARLTGSDRMEVTGAPGELIGTLAAGAAIPIYETTAEAADLEDVFLQLTGNLADQEAVR